VAFLPVGLDTLQQHVGRLPVIAYYVAPRLLNAGWSFVWPVVGATVVFGLARGRCGVPSSLWPLTAILYLLAMSASYVFSAFVPYQQHVVSSIDRLIGHVTPLVTLWVLSSWASARAVAGPGPTTARVP
jgi:hypothetical protein